MGKKKSKKKTIKLDPISSFVVIVFLIIGLGLGYFASTNLIDKSVNYKLIGDEICNVELNGTYVDEGIELKIGKKDYSKDVIITSNVNTSIEGVYYVYYTYNENNISINTTRVVIVGGI